MKRTAWLAAALMAGTLVPLGGRLAGDLSGTASAAAATPAAATSGPNSIVLENQKPGDTGWGADAPVTMPDEHGPRPDGVSAAAPGTRPCSSSFDINASQLEGYASVASINRGGNFTLHVRAVDTGIAAFDITIYRQGWYGGAGATKVTQINNVAVQAATVPAENGATGLVEAAWPTSATIQTGSDWTSGVYLAVLTPTTGADFNRAGNIPFIVRDDASASKILYVLPTSTWQAYNEWGGRSLYDFNSTGGPVSSLSGLQSQDNPALPTSRASQVSFNRPYCGNQGRGLFAGSDYPMIRFLEREGYDVAYAASQDLESNAGLLNSHAMFMTTWHDEYYSAAMRDHLTAARDAGKSLAFFTANSMYQQIQWAAASGPAGGLPNRTVITTKSSAKNPQTDTSRALNKPEISLLGGMFENALPYPQKRDWVVTNASSWFYAGTGLQNGGTIPNLVGYEWDTVDRYAALGLPAGVQKLSDSLIGTTLGSTPTRQQATVYQAASGAYVFNAATMYWSLLVDGFTSDFPVDAKVQQLTKNVLFRLGGGGTPGAAAGYWMLGSDGKAYPFGAAGAFGDAPVSSAAVDLEPNPTFSGYWIVDDQGHVYALGGARGDLGNADLSADQLAAGERVTSLSATPSGNGYWIFTNRGRVFTKGDAQAFGDLTAVPLNGPVLDSIPTPTGNGYFMVASDGGIFAFGDAVFRGSMGGIPLNAPVQSLVPTSTNQGYWLVASDGGIFAFGDGVFKGSMGDKVLNKPVTGMVRYGDGYLMVAEDGGIFAFSSTPFLGSLGDNPPANPIVSVAAQGT